MSFIRFIIIINTIFFSSQDLATVTIESNNQTQKLFENKKYKFSKENRLKIKEQLVKVQSKTQVTQAPFPFSLPTEQKQTMVTAISTTTITPSAVSKTVSKAFTIHNTFPLSFQKALTQKQNTIYYTISTFTTLMDT